MNTFQRTTGLLAVTSVILSGFGASVLADDVPDVQTQIRQLIPAATAIDTEVFEQIATNANAPTKESFKEHSLTAELILLDVLKVQQAGAEFRFLGDGWGEPVLLAKEMYRSIGLGRLRLVTHPVTMIQAERITKCEVSVDGNRATGFVAFRVPELYEGRAQVVAEKENSKWRITEFQMNHLGIHIRADDSGHWWRVSDLGDHALPTTLVGHRDTVRSIAFRADGERLVSGSSDRSIRVWDVANRTEVRTIRDAHQRKPPGGDGSVFSVEFSSDGKRIVSCSDDGTPKLWNAKTGEIQRILPINNLCTEARFSPEGQRILVASDDITIWNSMTGEKTLAIEQHSFPCVAFSPTGRRIASGGMEVGRTDPSDDGATIRIWDASNGNSLAVSETTHTELITDIVFSPDGQLVASGSRDTTVKIWQASDARERYTLDGHRKPVACVAFSPHGKWIASADSDGQLITWNVETGEQGESFPVHPGGIRCLAYSPDGQSIATAGDEGVIRFWKRER